MYEGIFGTQTRCFFFCDQLNIPIAGNMVPVMPVVFSGKPLDPVSCYRFSNLFRYGDTKARSFKTSWTEGDDKMFVLYLYSGSGQSKKFGSDQDPVCLGK